MSLDNDVDYKIYFDSLLQTLGDVVIFLSPEGIMTEISPLAIKFFSWNLEKLRGRSFETLYQMENIITPFSEEEFRKLCDTDVKIDCLVHVNNKQMTLSWSALKINPFPGIILIGHDVSEIKRLEIKHHTLNPQLEKISACIPGNFYWKNTHEQYLGCNDTLLKTLGLKSMAEIIGKTDWDLWPDEAEKLRENDQRVIQTGETLFLEEKVTMANHEDRYFTVIKTPLLDEDENIIGILGNSLDITELKNTQKELQIAKDKAESADHAKTEFIANMSHDIRTPLSGVVGMSQLLIDTIQNSQQKEYAEWLHESGEQLLGLLNGILDIISADQIDESVLHEEFFDIRQCIMSIIELERPTTHMKGLDLRIGIDSSIPKYIKTDRTKLHRILLNLLGNAIKFTDKGYVSIEAKLIKIYNSEATIRFSVVDSGIGIAKDQQDKVFDRFHRAVSSYKGVYAGHGVGLHIAQTYAALLGGTITLESELGVGTHFNVDLVLESSEKVDVESNASAPETTNSNAPKFPTLPVQVTASIHENPAPISQIDPNAPLLLLVEDNHIALKVAESVAASAGCRVKSAVDGEQALELAKTMPFNLIISDIGLPGISGYEFTHSLREWERVNNKTPVPIIGLTAHAEASAKEQARKSGMNDVFSKPINLSLMQNLLTKHLSLTELEIEQSPALAESTSGLGLDLPETEEELFILDAFPLLDIQMAKDSIGDENMLREILQMMMSEEIQKDIIKIKKAHTDNDWSEVERLAHKMKGGAVYIGTVKMRYACQYLERCQKAGLTKLLEPLYQQLLSVVVDTQTRIKEWLSN